jgi:hypothetical protein
MRREATEYDRMYRTDAGTAQHRDRGLGHHRHVNDDPVALADTQRRQATRELGCLVTQLLKAQRPLGAGHRAVVDQRRPIATTGFDVPIQRVVTGIQLTAAKPAIKRRV